MEASPATFAETVHVLAQAGTLITPSVFVRYNVESRVADFPPNSVPQYVFLDVSVFKSLNKIDSFVFSFFGISESCLVHLKQVGLVDGSRGHARGDGARRLRVSPQPSARIGVGAAADARLLPARCPRRPAFGSAFRS